MKTLIDEGGFDVKIEPSDWRYAAAIVGLARFFDYYEKDGVPFCIEKDCIKFNSDDITEERYLKFAEYFYGDSFHYVFLENLLKNPELSEEQIKLANEKLSGNRAAVVMKKIFKGCKAENDKEKILNLINSNRNEIIKETFRNKSDMYANFCNPIQLFKKDGEYTCRLLGYYIDSGRKSKSLGYKFQKSAIVFEDVPEFDFIPFGFAGNRTYYFINCNYNIENLIKENNNFRNIAVDNVIKGNKLTSKEILFRSISKVSNFIDYDVEVISKTVGIDNEFFETVFIRKPAINIFKEMGDSFVFLRRMINTNNNIYILDQAIDHILNNILCDDIIDKVIGNSSYGDCVYTLIKINLKLKGVDEVTTKMKWAYAAANDTVKILIKNKRENKLKSYRQRLISAVTFRDYDRVIEILLNLSSYTGLDYYFAYDLFEDFEGNKELIYTFINALAVKEEKDEKPEKAKEEK